MEPKIRKLALLIFIITILAGVAAMLILRNGLPLSLVKGDRRNQVVGTHNTSPTAPSEPVRLPTPTSVPIDSLSTSTPSTGQMGPEIPCFAFEQLPPVAFVPDGSGLMVRASSAVQVFNLESGSLEASIKSSQTLTSAALSPNGETLAWARLDNSIQLVRVSDQQVTHTLAGHSNTVTKLSFTPDGELLVSASHDLSVKVWNLSGKEMRSIQTDALGIGISPDSRLLATIPFDGPVALWDLSTGEKIKDLGGTGGYDTSDAVFSADGQYLVADLAPGLFLWRISDASVIWNGEKNSMAASYSPDGQYLAYSDINDDNKVVLASAETAQDLREIDRMESPVWDLTFSPNAALLAITDGREIHIRRVEDGQMLAFGKPACP